MKIFQELCFSPRLTWFSYALMLQHRKVRDVCSWKSCGKMQCLALSVVKFTNTPSAPFLFWEKLQREKGWKGVFPVKFQYRFLLAALDCCSSEYKGRSSQSCDGHLAAFPLCWARWGWPGQEEVPMIHRDHFPFSPSLSWARSYCLGFPETPGCWFGCLSSFIFATLQWLWLFGLCICTKEYLWFIIFFFPDFTWKEQRKHFCQMTGDGGVCLNSVSLHVQLCRAIFQNTTLLTSQAPEACVLWHICSDNQCILHRAVRVAVWVAFWCFIFCMKWNCIYCLWKKLIHHHARRLATEML